MEQIILVCRQAIPGWGPPNRALVAPPRVRGFAQHEVGREGVLDPGERPRGRKALLGGGVAGRPRAWLILRTPIVLWKTNMNRSWELSHLGISSQRLPCRETELRWVQAEHSIVCRPMAPGLRRTFKSSDPRYGQSFLKALDEKRIVDGLRA
jgi:hypothetical protein